MFPICYFYPSQKICFGWGSNSGPLSSVLELPKKYIKPHGGGLWGIPTSHIPLFFTLHIPHLTIFLVLSITDTFYSHIDVYVVNYWIYCNCACLGKCEGPRKLIWCILGWEVSCATLFVSPEEGMKGDVGHEVVLRFLLILFVSPFLYFHFCVKFSRAVCYIYVYIGPLLFWCQIFTPYFYP